MEDFASLIAAGETITPGSLHGRHKWFGDSFGETAGQPEPPTSGMVALAADLQAIQGNR